MVRFCFIPEAAVFVTGFDEKKKIEQQPCLFVIIDRYLLRYRGCVKQNRNLSGDTDFHSFQ